MWCYSNIQTLTDCVVTDWTMVGILLLFYEFSFFLRWFSWKRDKVAVKAKEQKKCREHRPIVWLLFFFIFLSFIHSIWIIYVICLFSLILLLFIHSYICCCLKMKNPLNQLHNTHTDIRNPYIQQLAFNHTHCVCRNKKMGWI